MAFSGDVEKTAPVYLFFNESCQDRRLFGKYRKVSENEEVKSPSFLSLAGDKWEDSPY